MKALKIIAIIVGLLVLIIVGVGVYFAYNTNRLIEAGVESLGSRYLGAPVSLGGVDFSWAEGRGTLSGLEIGNPEGYEGPFAFRLDTVTVVIDPAASTAETIVLKQVTMDGAQVAAEVKASGETNLQTLMSNLERETGGSDATEGAAEDDVEVIVDRLDFTGGLAHISAPILGQQTETKLPDLHLTDVGRKEGGVTAAEVVRQVLEPVTRAVLRDAAAKRLGVDEDAIKSRVGEEIERGLDRLRNLGHP